jgi:cytochrome c-type biogenesis protein CcmE
MRTFLALLLMTTAAHSQTVNNATVNIQGINQNVSITQSASGHVANLQLAGNGIEVSVTQSGISPQSFSLSITCGSSCPSSPYIVNQY